MSIDCARRCHCVQWSLNLRRHAEQSRWASTRRPGRKNRSADGTDAMNCGNGHGSMSCGRGCRDYGGSLIRRPADSTPDRPGGRPATRLATLNVWTQTMLVPAAAAPPELGIADSSSSSSSSRHTWHTAVEWESAIQPTRVWTCRTGRRSIHAAAFDAPSVETISTTQKLIEQVLNKTPHTHHARTHPHTQASNNVDFFLFISLWLSL